MKRYRSLRAFIGCIAMLALSSCKPGADDDNIITVNLSDVNRKRFVNLSDWVLEPEFIALDSSLEDVYTGGVVAVGGV